MVRRTSGWLAGLIAAAVFFGCVGYGASAAAEDAYVTRPHWLRRPAATDLRRLYPKEGRGVTGKASVECVVSDQGTLVDCVVVMEEPPGHGFGAATVKAARLFRLSLHDADGTSIAGKRTRLPIRWDPPPRR